MNSDKLCREINMNHETATIAHMDLTRRQLIGQLVIIEMGGRRWTEKDLADAARIGASSVSRVKKGAATVEMTTLLAVQAAFGWPRGFINYILDGQVDAILRLPGLPEDIRQFAVEGLTREIRDEENHNGL
jgi:hypothetical protein